MSAPAPEATSEAHAHVLRYAARLALPAAVRAALARATPVGEARDVWRVETRTWWEQRLYRYHGALETAQERGAYSFGSLRIATGELPDRWVFELPRPQPFQRPLFNVRPRKVSRHGVDIAVQFGTDIATRTLGEPMFPTAFVSRLPVTAHFEGVDSTPVVTAREGGPYRDVSVPRDRADIPQAVLRAIRDFVREIAPPSYAARIHGWRTVVQGGPVMRLSYALGVPALAGFTALVLPYASAVYAPDLSDTVLSNG